MPEVNWEPEKIIDFLKLSYRNGMSFANRGAIKRAIMAEFPAVHSGWLSPETVRYFDRRARYELAAEDLAVTSPVGVYGYEREPTPRAMKRMASRQPRYDDVTTRLNTLHLLTKADAVQIDATNEERANVTLLSLALDIVRRLARAANDN